MTSSIPACLRRYDGLGCEALFWMGVVLFLLCVLVLLGDTNVRLVVWTKDKAAAERSPSTGDQPIVRLTSSIEVSNASVLEEVQVSDELRRYDIAKVSEQRRAGIN